MKTIIYVIVSFFSTLIGSISGMGGGVIMKPIFDMLGEYSPFQISVLTSSTVFAMSAVSVATGYKKFREEKDNNKTFLFIAAGSLVGGYIGNALFNLLIGNVKNESAVKAIQNGVLLLLVCAVIIYMNKKERKSLEVKNNFAGAPVGLILGIISAFLGIGGGPINVAVLIFVFGFEIKTAVLCSLLSVFLCQGAKLLSTGSAVFSAFSTNICLFVVAAGVFGALCGRMINKKLSGKAVGSVYTAVQIIVIIMCALNICRSLFA
ncbi:MAG: sulfite exporter TauE/SafE family protein [Eubacterium sp.]|nr:sulfite exporter TauE/SafE family protein [Eubacterium sp.]MBR4241153.1 sulfite exporter TauE/SafE family protein [Eubacterium sp.]